MAPSPEETEYLNRWQALETHFNKWYYQFDLEALRLAMAAYAAHWILSDPPVWLFIVGPPGSGKTVIIEAMEALFGTKPMGDITSNTFLSGFRSGSGGSLLRRYGNSFLMLWKDFTTILSKRQETKIEIIGQLREIYDGHFTKSTGASKETPWQGKATVIAAVTGVIDHQFLLLRDLGERFIYVRWDRRPGIEMNRMAALHAGHEDEIKSGNRHTIFNMIDRETLNVEAVKLIDLEPYGLYSLAELVALLRSNVRHNDAGKILDVPQAEQGTRISKSLSQLIRAHAALFRRQIGPLDIPIARRAAMDSVPQVRRKIFDAMADDDCFSAADLVRITGIFHAAVEWALKDMEAMGILRATESDGMREYHLTKHFVELRKAAFPPLKIEPPKENKESEPCPESVESKGSTPP